MPSGLLYNWFEGVILVFLLVCLFYLIYKNFFNTKIIEGKRRRRRRKKKKVKVNVKKIGRDVKKGVDKGVDKVKKETSGFSKEAEKKANELVKNI